MVLKRVFIPRRPGTVAVVLLAFVAVFAALPPLTAHAVSKPKICFKNGLKGNKKVRNVEFRVVLAGRPDEHSKELQAGKSDCVTWGVFDEGCIPGKEYTVKAKVNIKMGGDEHLEVQSARCGDTVRLSKKKGNYKLTIDRGQKCFQYEDKRCAKVKSSTRQYILLAHGMNDQKRVWDHFADRIAKKYPKITVLRTSVSRCGSILERAEQLADYINKTSKELGIADGAIKAVGHSMGGIDLRYIVGNAQKNKRFKQAARKFKRIYTIGTPHHGARGSEISTLWKGCAEASLDLSESAMAAFNKKYPYRDFKVDGRRIPFLAFNFVCDSWGGNAIPIGDCVVSANSQAWRPAPLYCGGPLNGRHSVGNGSRKCEAELNNNTVLDTIVFDPVCR